MVSYVRVPCNGAEDFLEKAVRIANKHLWGTLSCTILLHPEMEAKYPKAVEKVGGWVGGCHVWVQRMCMVCLYVSTCVAGWMCRRVAKGKSTLTGSTILVILGMLLPSVAASNGQALLLPCHKLALLNCFVLRPTSRLVVVLFELQAIEDLKYGLIAINTWSAMSFVIGTTTWGGYAGGCDGLFL